MKLRNFIIVLLAIFMVFAFASCKNEPTVEPTPGPDPGPGPEPEPVEGTVYQIQVTQGVDKDYWNRDKIKLQWAEEVNEGDVISLKYRSERDIYQWDIRDGSLKWVYESKKGSFTDPVLGEDGWYTLTYTFAKDINGADVDYPNEQFSVFFRGNFVTTDLFEIKDITLNGKPLAVEEDTIISYAELKEEPVDFDWSVKNYTVLFATGTPGEVDKTPIAEKVVAGGYVTGAPIAKDGYTLTIYTDTAHTQEFDQSLPINEEKIFYYEYVGVPRTITFELNGGAFPTDAEIPETVANGDMLVAPAEPVLEGKAFKAWYVDEALTTPWVFTDAVTGDLKLYAAYGDPVTVTFELNGGTFGEDVANTKVVCVGNAVAEPAIPTNGTKMFLGWYADEAFETPYVFSTPVTEPITIYANWINSTDVTIYPAVGAEAVTFKAALDVPLSADDENLQIEDDAIGYVFEGWYTDATFETPYDFETVVTGPVTLYGHWVEATLYQLVSTHDTAESIYDFDKFTVQYSDGKVNAGDVLSFRYRSTTDFTFFSIRGDKKWVYEDSSATRGMTTLETAEDGWTYVTYVFSATDTSGAAISADAWWRFDFGSRTIVKGDVLEIQDWALNGEPLEITAANLTKYVQPTVEVLDGDYEWTDVTVNFELGENATAIEPATVEFGGTIEEPKLAIAEGYAFAGWYADAELTKEFDFARPIIKETTIYAKIGVAKTVTFDLADDSTPTVVTLAEGEAVAEPADPVKDGSVFAGWFLADATEVYDFSTPVTEDITLYAHWISSVKLRLNANDGTDAVEALDVEKGVALDTPKNLTRVGYYFGGWYAEATCETAFDFSAGITADTDVYAKWNDPVTYLCTSTISESRWQFRWHEDTVEMFNANIQAGDVFTLMLKFPETNTLAEGYWRIRTRSGEKHITENIDFSSTTKTEDGWYLIEVTVPAGIENGSGVYLQVYGKDEASWPVGSKMIIKGFAFNGEEIEISAAPYGSHNSHKGAYEKVGATVEVVE